MAKKSKKKDTEVITICDNQQFAVANCDHPKEVIANCENLRSLKFYPSLPYAYTEQGIGQSSTVESTKNLIHCICCLYNI